MKPRTLAPLLAALCVRGSLDYSTGMDQRRAVRYLDRLRAAREYRQAIDDLRRTEPQAAP
jgi:hypothetical protein